MRRNVTRTVCAGLLLLAGMTAAAAQAPSMATITARNSLRAPTIGNHADSPATLSTLSSADDFVEAWRSFQSPTAPRPGADSNFDAVLAAVEAAQVQLLNGQPGPFKALWSQADDVTLSGGLGGAIARGWREVSERLDWVATQYRDGARTHQELARYVGQDLAYVVLRETIRFKSPLDGRSTTQELRVTQVFRHEAGRWRIVHRHADSQVAKTPSG